MNAYEYNVIFRKQNRPTTILWREGFEIVSVNEAELSYKPFRVRRTTYIDTKISRNLDGMQNSGKI